MNLEKEIELLKEIIKLKERIIELESQPDYGKWLNPYPQQPVYPMYPQVPYPVNPYAPNYPFTTWV